MAIQLFRMFGGNFSPTLAGAPNSRLSEDKSGDDAKPPVEPRRSTRFRWFSYKPPNPQPWLCAKCSRATSERKQLLYYIVVFIRWISLRIIIYIYLVYLVYLSTMFVWSQGYFMMRQHECHTLQTPNFKNYSICI